MSPKIRMQQESKLWVMLGTDSRLEIHREIWGSHDRVIENTALCDVKTYRYRSTGGVYRSDLPSGKKEAEVLESVEGSLRNVTAKQCYKR
jgi:hypothetical protein